MTMSTQLARAYQVNELTDQQIQYVHEIEKKRGLPMLPFEINENYGLSRHGDVPHEIQSQLNKAIFRVFFRIRDEMWKRCNAGAEWSEIALQHQIDWEVKKLSLVFDSGGKQSVLSRIRSRDKAESF